MECQFYKQMKLLKTTSLISVTDYSDKNDNPYMYTCTIRKFYHSKLSNFKVDFMFGILKTC